MMFHQRNTFFLKMPSSRSWSNHKIGNYRQFVNGAPNLFIVATTHLLNSIGIKVSKKRSIMPWRTHSTIDIHQKSRFGEYCVQCAALGLIATQQLLGFCYALNVVLQQYNENLYQTQCTTGSISCDWDIFVILCWCQVGWCDIIAV